MGEVSCFYFREGRIRNRPCLSKCGHFSRSLTGSLQKSAAFGRRYTLHALSKKKLRLDRYLFRPHTEIFYLIFQMKYQRSLWTSGRTHARLVTLEKMCRKLFSHRYRPIFIQLSQIVTCRCTQGTSASICGMLNIFLPTFWEVATSAAL